MKQKKITRRERQAVRQIITQRIQELEMQALPLRAALALLNMREAAAHPIDPVRLLLGEKEARQ